MDIFDNIGKKASEAYKFTADKTNKIAKETKIKFKMNELKSQIEDLYVEIGKKVYEKRIREEKIEIKDDLEELCTKIDVLSDQIEVMRKECLDLKDKKQCKECYGEIDKDDKFCKNCGAKQPEGEEQTEKNDTNEKEVNEDTVPEDQFVEVENIENQDETMENQIEIQEGRYENLNEENNE